MNIRKSIFIALLFIGSTAMAENHIVVMKSISYEPKKLQIKAGDTVQWENKSYTDHSATSYAVPPVFATGMIKPKDISEKVEFPKTGDFEYHCSMHGKAMSGEITVVQ